MGYSTDFEGQLSFKKELTVKAVVVLEKFLGQDRRDIPGFEGNEIEKKYGDHFYHIDVELTEEKDGLKWSGDEKTYGMVAILNFLLDQVREVQPEQGYTGVMSAQGEDPEDTWRVVAKEDGTAEAKQ